jgi:hypothetical protein
MFRKSTFNKGDALAAKKTMVGLPPTIPEMHAGIVTGWMQKEGGKFMTTWQNRFFALRSGGQLFYWESENDYIGTLLLHQHITSTPSSLLLYPSLV